MDLAREDMKRVGAKEGDKVDREKWKILSRCSDPEQGETERRKRGIRFNLTVKISDYEQI